MATSVDSQSPTPVPMPAVIHYLASGWTPSTPLRRVLIELEPQDIEPTLFPRALRVDGERLVVSCEVASPEGSLGELASTSSKRLRLKGECEDGAVLSVEDAVVESLKRKAPHAFEVELSCHDWVLCKPVVGPLLWAGFLETAPQIRGGNLELSSADGYTAEAHYCLKGRPYTYYLIRRHHHGDESWLLVVEPQEGASAERATGLDRDLLRRDLLSIAFSFGRPFSVGKLHALNKDGDEVGVLVMRLGERFAGPPRSAPPVPQRVGQPLWPLVFFEAFTNTWASSGGPKAELERVLRCFFEALCEPSADGFMLRLLQGACVAANLVVGGEGTPGDVSLVAQQEAGGDRGAEEDAPAQNLAAEEAPDERAAPPRHAERQRASGVLRRALSHVGLEMTNEMAAAVDSAERELLGEREKALPSDERAAILRTLLVALVAKRVQYTGRICGWKKQPHTSVYEEADPRWWRVPEATPTVERFTAKAPEQAEKRSPGAHWPRFQLPRVPLEGPIAALASFAGALEARTGGLVLARVKPRLPYPGERPRFDFVLEPANRPNAETVLFSIEEGDDGKVVITSWEEEEEDLQLNSGAEVERFIERIAQSGTTLNRVQRQMARAAERPAG